MTKLAACALIPVLLTACTSSTMIRTNVPNATIYIDGAPRGTGTVTMSDTKIVGSTTQIRIEAPGYQTMHATIARNEAFDVGACIGGVLVLVPFLWIMGYNPEHYYELQPAAAAPAPPPAAPPQQYPTQ